MKAMNRNGILEKEGTAREAVNFDELAMLLEAGVLRRIHPTLLRDALFYYCAGKDPTPIVAFKGAFPLYIYADLVCYGRGVFAEETAALYERLQGQGICLCEKKHLCRYQDFSNAALTEWAFEDERFFLLYIQGDAVRIFSSLYGAKGLIPACICNIKYEMNTSFFAPIERRVSYLFGYAYSDAYRVEREYPYFGDYGNAPVKLFCRDGCDPMDENQ